LSSPALVAGASPAADVPAASAGTSSALVRVDNTNTKVGLEVVRGPDWKWEDQDGGLGCRGIVVAVESDGTWTDVAWKTSGLENSYRSGAENAYDLCVAPPAVSTPVPPAAVALKTNNVVGDQSFKRGARVVRGPDWKWGDQDGRLTEHRGFGTLVRIEPGDNAWCSIRWDTGRENSYRCGRGFYDIAYAPDAPPPPEPREGDLVTTPLAIAGRRVRFNSTWTGPAHGAGHPGVIESPPPGEAFEPGRVWVRWEHSAWSHKPIRYSCGLNATHDLVFVGKPTPPSSSAQAAASASPGAALAAAAGTAPPTEIRGPDPGDLVTETTAAKYPDALVQRGPDWRWGNQDGGEGGHGKLLPPQPGDPKGWASVQWEGSSRTCRYRVGAEYAFDLLFV
jgi:Mib_herc2.